MKGLIIMLTVTRNRLSLSIRSVSAITALVFLLGPFKSNYALDYRWDKHYKEYKAGIKALDPSDKQHVMVVCNSICCLAPVSDTQNNRLLLFGILTSNVELVDRALARHTSRSLSSVMVAKFITAHIGYRETNHEHPALTIEQSPLDIADQMGKARISSASYAVFKKIEAKLNHG